MNCTHLDDLKQYLSISDILSASGSFASSRAPCCFTYRMPHMAAFFNTPTAKKLYHEDDDEPDDTVPVGQTVTVPIWLAEVLLKNDRHWATLQYPHTFRESMREIYYASSESVDLKSLEPYFYLLAYHLIDFPVAESLPLIKTCMHTLTARFRMILDSSLNARPNDGVTSINKFEELELSFYRAGQLNRVALSRWRQRDLGRIEASDMVKRFKRQKLGF